MCAQDGWASGPVYTCPRVIRFAAFVGTDYRELDLVASHPRQIYKFALKHELKVVVLSVFRSEAEIEAFRNSFDGISPASIKSICNKLAYGNGGDEWCTEHGVERLPDRLAALKREIAGVIKCVWERASESEKQAVSTRENTELTLLSGMCQAGERCDIDASISALPAKVHVLGFLGDSFIYEGSLDEAAFSKEMMELDILIKSKPLPRTPEEYHTALDGIDKLFDMTPLSAREIRRLQAKHYAERWIFGDDMRYCPDQEIVIAIEHMLPVCQNLVTKQLEYYDDRTGLWAPGGGETALKGEDLSRPLIETFKCYAPTLVRGADDKETWRPMECGFDDSMFRNNKWLSELASQARALKGLVRPPLDSTPESHYIRNLRGGWCLDFNVKTQGERDPHNDADLEANFFAPLRRCRMEDRTSRCCQVEFGHYNNSHKWDLLRLGVVTPDEKRERSIRFGRIRGRRHHRHYRRLYAGPLLL